MIYATPQAEGMTGPIPATEFPRFETPGFPAASDRHAGWRLARSWAGSPELEWTFQIMVQRVNTFGDYLPALFYEPLEDFDVVRRLLRLSAHIASRRDWGAPLVRIGFAYFNRTYLVGDGRLRLPRSGEPFRGRHSAVAYDHDDLETIRFANSWGTVWGDSGYGYIDRDYFESYVDAVWVSWPAVRGRSPKMNGCLRNPDTRRLPANERELHCWSTPNEYSREEFVHRGVYHELLSWAVYSWQSGTLVDVLEVRSPSRIVGRLHLHYESDTAVIKELFVAPKMRRRGYGSILEAVAVERCRAHELRVVQIWLGEADAQRLRAGPETFAAARGYVWANSTRRRPNIVSVATKEIR